MANKKITQLNAASSVTEDAVLPISQSGSTFKATIPQLRDAIGTTGEGAAFANLKSGPILISDKYVAIPTFLGPIKGRLHAVFTTGDTHTSQDGFISHIYTDDGVNWSAPVNICDGGDGFAVGVYDNEIVGYTNSLDPTKFGEIFRSSGNGTSWSVTEAPYGRPHFDGLTGTVQSFGEIKEDHLGRLYSNYYRDTADGGGGMIRSEDGGDTYTWVGLVATGTNEISFQELPDGNGGWYYEAVARDFTEGISRRYQSFDDGVTYTLKESMGTAFPAEVNASPTDVQYIDGQICLTRGFRNNGGRIRVVDVPANPTATWNVPTKIMGKSYANSKGYGYEDWGYCSTKQIRPGGPRVTLFYDRAPKSPTTGNDMALYIQVLDGQIYATLRHDIVSVPSQVAFTMVNSGFAVEGIDAGGFLTSENPTQIVVPEDGYYNIVTTCYGMTGTDMRTMAVYVRDPGTNFSGSTVPVRYVNSGSFLMNNNVDLSVFALTSSAYMKKGEKLQYGLLQASGTAKNWTISTIDIAKISD